MNYFDLDTYTATISVTLGNTQIQSQEITMPSIMIIQQFQGLCEQLAQDSRPMMCSCYRYEYCDKAKKNLKHEVIFKNNSYCKEFGEESNND